MNAGAGGGYGGIGGVGGGEVEGDDEKKKRKDSCGFGNREW